MNIMKKSVITLLLLGILLVTPLVLAQEQAQTYSGFDRFIDNVKMFFSFGDKKVMLTLDIREKELNSAIMNAKNGDEEEAEKNLERAKERLQFVQNKVSKDIAEDVKTNIDKTINKINEEENLPDNFRTYILEEEKTQLKAELVIEGKGQTLTKEMVKDEATGENTVEVTVEEDGGIQDFVDEETKSMEIEGKSAVIDNQIAKIIEGESNVVESGENQIDPGVDPDATPKTPIPTDGSICCKKTKDGETRYHWDSEGDCLNPANVKGEVVDNDVCVALGTEVLDEEDPESWGSVEGGVPEPCVEQGAYDDEACERIMEMLEICCRRVVDGEVVYGWVPGKICVSPYGDRAEDDSCLA